MNGGRDVGDGSANHQLVGYNDGDDDDEDEEEEDDVMMMMNHLCVAQ